jgi:hypothetical protein
MAEVATLTLRADISDLQRKLRAIPDDAAGSAKQMAVTLEREFKRASAAAEAAAKASASANSRAAAEAERAAAKLQDYLAAGDPVAELTLKFQRQAAEIERIAKVTGNAEGAQTALAKASASYADELAALTKPAQDGLDAVDQGAQKAAGSNWKLNQQTLSLRKNVGDFANSLLAGQSPFTVLAQQGPQVLEIFAEADSVTELLESSFGKVITKAKSFGGVIAVAAVAVAAAVTAYSMAANAADQFADGNNRLANTFRKLREEVDVSTASLNAQRDAMNRVKEAADTRRQDLLVEIGALDEHAVAAERDKKAVAEAARADMLAITTSRAKLAVDLETVDAMWRKSKAGSEERKEAARLTQEYRAAIKVEDEKIAAAQANYNQQLDDIDNLRLIRQVKAAEEAATKSGTAARKDSSKADKDAEKAARDLAKAYEDVADVVASVVESNATEERKLEIAAADRIKVLTDIADKYAEQPDLVEKAAAAEFAVREQLRADVAKLRTEEAEEFEKAKQTLHERDLARAKELADADARLQAQRLANVQALSTFSSGVSDLLAQRSEANAKRDRELALRQFKASKAAAIAEATINGAVAITRALASLGPVAGALATAGISASTAAQIGVIASQKPAFDRGGLIQGGRMADQVSVNALPGEAVLSRGAVRAVGGQQGVDRLNRGAGDIGQGVVMVPVYKHFGRFVQDEVQRDGVLRRATLRGRPLGALGY